MNDFASLMETIRFLGGRENRTKEETLAYDKFLIYAGALATVNADTIHNELIRRENDYGKRSFEKIEEGH